MRHLVDVGRFLHVGESARDGGPGELDATTSGFTLTNVDVDREYRVVRNSSIRRRHASDDAEADVEADVDGTFGPGVSWPATV